METVPGDPAVPANSSSPGRTKLLGMTTGPDRQAADAESNAYRVSLRYLMRCGWSASVPSRRWRSAS